MHVGAPSGRLASQTVGDALPASLAGGGGVGAGPVAAGGADALPVCGAPAVPLLLPLGVPDDTVDEVVAVGAIADVAGFAVDVVPDVAPADALPPVPDEVVPLDAAAAAASTAADAPPPPPLNLTSCPVQGSCCGVIGT